MSNSARAGWQRFLIAVWSWRRTSNIVFDVLLHDLMAIFA
jgi:hypothetical protein